MLFSILLSQKDGSYEETFTNLMLCSMPATPSGLLANPRELCGGGCTHTLVVEPNEMRASPNSSGDPRTAAPFFLTRVDMALSYE